MTPDHSSEIDWHSRLGRVEFEFEELWQSEPALRRIPPGQTASHALTHFLSAPDRVANDHVPLRILPIDDLVDASDDMRMQALFRFTHMFTSHLWFGARNHCAENGGVTGFGLSRVIDAMKSRIDDELDDAASKRLYELALVRAGDVVRYLLVTSYAKEIIADLDRANHAALIDEARAAYRQGLFSRVEEEEEQDDVLMMTEYVEWHVERLVD